MRTNSTILAFCALAGGCVAADGGPCGLAGGPALEDQMHSYAVGSTADGAPAVEVTSEAEGTCTVFDRANLVRTADGVALEFPDDGVDTIDPAGAELVSTGEGGSLYGFEDGSQVSLRWDGGDVLVDFSGAPTMRCWADVGAVIECAEE